LGLTILERSGTVKKNLAIQLVNSADNQAGSANRFFAYPDFFIMEKKKAKNPNAVALGRLGGLKGGKARIAQLTPEERRELARKAVQARWAKEKARKQKT
jgi:hypothetical protein